MKNILVAQSGGPTTVINASISGLILACVESTEIDKIYGAFHGIAGVIEDDLLCFNDIPIQEIKYLKTTPSAALGSCRVKLTPDLYDDILKTLTKYNIDVFFYTGGNDSMDTVYQLSEYAKEKDIDIQFIGIPKTIDNDLEEIDHTPGFGSCSKFVASSICEMNRDAIVYDKKTITIIEVMGRDTGWIAASAGISYESEGVPDLIYVPEIPFSLEKFENDIKEIHKIKDSCLIVVSEGIKYANGNFVADTENSEVDSFGHKRMGGVHSVLKHFIESKVDATVKSIEFGIQQRCAMSKASLTDLEETFKLGAYALQYALKGETGVMSRLTRLKSDKYEVEYSSVPVSLVANKVKFLPLDFLNEKGTGISKKGMDYFLPLMQGEIRVPKSDGVYRYSKISPAMKSKKQCQK